MSNEGHESQGRQAPTLSDLIVAGFSTAESAAEEVIELLLIESAKLLYQHELEKKAFPFAADTISHLLIQELELRFVRHDEGEPPQPLLAQSKPQRQISGNSNSEDFRSRQVSGNSPDSHAKQMTGNSEDIASPLAVVVRSIPVPLDMSHFNSGMGDEGSTEFSCNDLETTPLCSSWHLEREPARCRIDTWARSCIPVQRKLVRTQSKNVAATLVRQSTHHTPRSTSIKSMSMSSRSASKAGTKNEPILESIADDRSVKNFRDSMIALVEEVEQDEEETVLREMKDREAKRRREEESRLQRKAAEEADEAIRMAQVKDQMKHKPYTYDSSGKIVWVQALAPDKMPSAIPVPTVSFKPERELKSSGNLQAEHKDSCTANQARNDKKKPKSPNRRTKDMEFKDSFTRFTSQQPRMMEAMKMKPGVLLYERGNMKRGETDDVSQTRMTRQQYEATKSDNAEDSPRSKHSLAALKEVSSADATSHRQSAQDIPSPNIIASEANGSEAIFAVPRRSVASGIIPQPPTAPRPDNPMPPASVRREQMKRAALGYFGQSTRERVRTGTGSRFPTCAPAPVLGATMGHGLLPQGSKHEEYYFPNSKNTLFDSEGEFALPSGRISIAESSRTTHGHIVGKNRDLARKLFDA